MKTLQRIQRSKYAIPKGSNVAVSSLWFTVSGKMWKIEPNPEQTLKIVFTGRTPRSLYSSYIWFDWEILVVALRQDYRQCNLFFADSIILFKKNYQKKGHTISFFLNLHPGRRNPCIDEPTSLYFFLFQESFNAQDALENVVAQRKIIFESQIDP